MKYYLAGGLLVGTQADAKKADPNFVEHHVPDDKEGRMEYVNGLLRKIAELETSPAPAQPPAPTAQPQEGGRAPAMADEQRARFESLARRLGWIPKSEAPAPAAPKFDAPADLAEAIIDAPADQMPRILSTAIGRLGEIGTSHGWAAFGKDVYAWTPASKAVEQGLGMLMLAAVRQIGKSSDEPPVS